MKKRNNSTKILDDLSLYIFACIFCSSTISIMVSYLLLYFGVFNFSGISIYYRITISIFLCFLFGTIVSAIIGRKSNNYIIEIANAINEVANGNFNYKLRVSDKVIFKDVAKTFNTMVKELSSMEILRQDFIANFSHEFRTPINSICGYAELLKNPDILEENKIEYINVIINESKRLFHLADNILYLSNLRSVQKLPEEVHYRIDEQIRGILVTQEKNWEKRNISLVINLDKITIKAREEFLYHIWSNLIINAIKFTNDSINISLHETDDEIVFSITDNGPGMSENTIKHISDMFYQADSSHNKGSGLGMAIVKKITDICDYKLEIISTIDQGSTFNLRIPKI